MGSKNRIKTLLNIVVLAIVLMAVTANANANANAEMVTSDGINSGLGKRKSLIL